MGRVLFIGNGPNRLYGQSNSWEQLLLDLAEHAGKSGIIKHLIRYKPLSLVFEEICVLSQRISRISELEIKRKAAKLVKNIPSNEMHQRIVYSGVKHIITTNYDYNIESKSEDKHVKANVRKETKYSLFRRRKVGTQYVWHIHGEANFPNTLTMGHEQFSGSLQKIRSYTTSSKKKRFPERSPFIDGNPHFDTSNDYAWVDVFLRDDVYILGFGLDYTEIDIWWLLSYKERLKLFKGYSVGKTEYYEFYNGDMDKEDEAKLSILKSLGVNVHAIEVDGNYEKAYDGFFDSISNGSISERSIGV
jgi:hypothetical protein